MRTSGYAPVTSRPARRLTAPISPGQYTFGQYTLRALFGIWAAASLPLAGLAWLVAPWLAPRAGLPPALTYWLLTVAGAAWQGLLALYLLRREGVHLDWAALQSRTWLVAPTHQANGRRRRRSFAWLAVAWPVAFGVLGAGLVLSSPIAWASFGSRLLGRQVDIAWLVPSYTQITELASPEFAGRWLLLGPVVLGWLLSVAGEELLYRGVLLPRMAAAAGRKDWVLNGLLYGLGHLHKPWMIPAHAITGLMAAGLARRWRSAWLAVGVRAAEGLALVGLFTWGIAATPLPPLAGVAALPNVAARPQPSASYRGPLAAIPAFRPEAYTPGQVFLAGADLSALDLRGEATDLSYAWFDSNTIWPPAERMPAAFDPGQVLERGKNPGLGVRGLHARGITGRRVGIGVIDQRLLTEHVEFADRLRWYEEIGAYPGTAAMHGPAVASLAAGRTVGVAPDADLYYIGVVTDVTSIFSTHHRYAQAIRRLLALNATLPAGRRIRVISISMGWKPGLPGYDDIHAAVQQAQADGVFVVSTAIEDGYGFWFRGLGREPMADPDAYTSYGPGIWWAGSIAAGARLHPDALLVPMDSRTFAAPSGAGDYMYNPDGGESWSVPWISGLYALAAQVRPEITPQRFWSLALATGRTIELGAGRSGEPSLGTAVDPVALIAALEGGR